MAQVILITDGSGSMRAIGAYQIANFLRQNGYSVQVIDFRQELIEQDFLFFLSLVGKFLDDSTLWIGFSTTFMFKAGVHRWHDVTTMFMDFDQAFEFRNFVRDNSPKCKIVVGGSRAKFFERDIPKIVDAYIQGYAEISALEFTNYCAGKNPFFVAQQNTDGSISINNNLTAVGFEYTDHKFSWHESDHILQHEALPIEISRGCIFKCSFCAYPLHGRKKLDYLKDPAILLDQFNENYERFGTTNYFFLDDTHNDNVKKLEILHDKVFSKLKFKINYCAYLRLDLINAHPESIQLLRDSGLSAAFLGIESLNYESSKSIGKGLPPDKIIRTLTALKTECPNVTLHGGFIIGLPHESEATARNWLSTITQPGFPLDGIMTFALILNHPIDKAGRSWFSELETNPEKFGYTFDENGDWTNSAGLTRGQAIQLENEYRVIAEQNKVNDRIGMAARVGSINFGITDNQARLLTPGGYNALVETERQKRIDNYVNCLLNSTKRN